MDNIQKQIEKSRACAQRVRLSKFPDYHAAMWLERNADTMEKLLAVYEKAKKIEFNYQNGCTCSTCQPLWNLECVMEELDPAQTNQRHDDGEKEAAALSEIDL